MATKRRPLYLQNQMSPSRHNTIGKGTKLFLSYRRTDSPGHAGRLYADLNRHFGADQVFMDTTGIEGGEDFIRVIEERLGSCKVLIAVLGSRWLELLTEARRSTVSQIDWVSLEIATALEKRIPVIPVLVDRGEIPPITNLPEELKSLARLQAVKIRDDRWDLDVAHLVRLLEKTVAPKQKRVALALSGLAALALIAMSFLVYHLVTVPLAAKPDAYGKFDVPAAVAGTHEVVVEGPEINTSVELLLSHAAGPSEEIKVEIDKGQLSGETIDSLDIDARAATTFGKIIYASAGPYDVVRSKRPCSTSIELRLINKKLPDTISFSQAPSLHDGGGVDYRELKMKSGGADLFISMSMNPQSGPDDKNTQGDENGPGCVKHLIEYVDPQNDHPHFGALAVDGVVAANSDVYFRFTPTTSAPLWKDEAGPFVFGSAKLNPEDPPPGLQARAVYIKSLKGEPIFEIRSVDQTSRLRVDALAVEANRLQLSVSGEAAFVTQNGRDGVGMRERVQRSWFGFMLVGVVIVSLVGFLIVLALRLLRR